MRPKGLVARATDTQERKEIKKLETVPIYSAPQLVFPLMYFLVFTALVRPVFNNGYIARKPGTRCIFWYIYLEHQVQFEV